MRANDLHPMRWRAARSQSGNMLKALTRFDQRISSNIKSKSEDLIQQTGLAYVELAAEVGRCHNAMISRVPIHLRPDTSFLKSELDTLMVVGRHLRSGNNNFRLSDGLAQALQNTDLEGVRSGDLRFPYEQFYLSLNGGLKIGLPGAKNVIDGAYVNSGGKADDDRWIALHLTTRSDKPYDERRGAFDDPSFHVHLDLEGPDDTLSDALERAVAEMDLDDSNIDAPAEFLDHVPGGGVGLSISKRKNAERARFRNDSLPAVREALAMIINAVAWLSIEPNEAFDGPVEWTDDAPPSKVEAIANAKTARKRQYAKDELLRRGYTSIRILGSSIPTIRQNNDEGLGEVRPHWRRGHYTHQAHGPGLSLRKLRWIKPLIVRHDLGEPEVGHVYTMGP